MTTNNSAAGFKSHLYAVVLSLLFLTTEKLVCISTAQQRSWKEVCAFRKQKHNVNMPKKPQKNQSRIFESVRNFFTLFSFLKNLMAQYKTYLSSSIVFNNNIKNPDHQQFKNTTKFSDKRLGDLNMQRLRRKGAERALPEHLHKSSAEVCAVSCAHIPGTLQTTPAQVQHSPLEQMQMFEWPGQCSFGPWCVLELRAPPCSLQEPQDEMQPSLWTKLQKENALCPLLPPPRPAPCSLSLPSSS